MRPIITYGAKAQKLVNGWPFLNGNFKEDTTRGNKNQQLLEKTT
jgi:hypothetical protein